jgi:hypothetical protein
VHPQVLVVPEHPDLGVAAVVQLQESQVMFILVVRVEVVP